MFRPRLDRPQAEVRVSCRLAGTTTVTVVAAQVCNFLYSCSQLLHHCEQEKKSWTRLSHHIPVAHLAISKFSG